MILKNPLILPDACFLIKKCYDLSFKRKNPDQNTFLGKIIYIKGSEYHFKQLNVRLPKNEKNKKCTILKANVCTI
jgi:hypothetical protein